ncbi:MAG: ATP-binding protein [Rhizobiaceae bacterium]|nr:ATP-binding protein [Rhizobiaceae bacterium]
MQTAEPNLLGLVAHAFQFGVEITIEEIRKFPEFEELGLITACQEIEKKLEECGLEMTPPILEGELDEIRYIARKRQPESFETALDEALGRGECQSVEFKESLHLKKQLVDNPQISREHLVSQEIVFECIKTVCAFLNADGGTLLVGVNDDAEPCGLECELGYLPGNSKTLDDWELYFANRLEHYIHDYRSCIGHVSWRLVTVGDVTVCVVVVRPRRHALTVCRHPRNLDDELVYLRNGNGSAQIKARAIEGLVKNRLENQLNSG